MSLIENEHFNETAMEAQERDWFDDLFNADFQRDKADRALLSVEDVSRLAYLLEVDYLIRWGKRVSSSNVARIIKSIPLHSS